MKPIRNTKYLFTVPSSSYGTIVMPDCDPAKGADELTDLHVENVDQTTLKSSSFQENLAAVFDALGSVHDHVDL